MCTALNLNKKGINLFGRNMDIEAPFGQQIVITPRDHVWPMRFLPELKQQHAIIGMAFPFQDPTNGGKDYPLYAEAANEKGLACAGLNFPGTAFYPEPGSTKATKGKLVEITPFEVIQFFLANFTSVDDVKKFLDENTLAIVNKPIIPQLAVAPLHFIISDKNKSIVIEPCKDGLKVHDNPIGILTNNPSFDWQMLNLSMYQNLTNEQKYDVKWGDFEMKPFGQGMAQHGLPGDTTPPSRFVRTAFYKVNSSCGDTLEDMVTQFFHILDGVSMVKGAIKVRTPKGDVHDDITLYTSCIDLDNGVYYYKSYYDNQINAIDMHSEKLDGDKVIVYPFSMKQNFNFVNKK